MPIDFPYFRRSLFRFDQCDRRHVLQECAVMISGPGTRVFVALRSEAVSYSVLGIPLSAAIFWNHGFGRKTRAKSLDPKGFFAENGEKDAAGEAAKSLNLGRC